MAHLRQQTRDQTGSAIPYKLESLAWWADRHLPKGAALVLAAAPSPETLRGPMRHFGRPTWPSRALPSFMGSDSPGRKGGGSSQPTRVPGHQPLGGKVPKEQLGARGQWRLPCSSQTMQGSPLHPTQSHQTPSRCSPSEGSHIQGTCAHLLGAACPSWPEREDAWGPAQRRHSMTRGR